MFIGKECYDWNDPLLGFWAESGFCRVSLHESSTGIKGVQGVHRHTFRLSVLAGRLDHPVVRTAAATLATGAISRETLAQSQGTRKCVHLGTLDRHSSLPLTPTPPKNPARHRIHPASASVTAPITLLSRCGTTELPSVPVRPHQTGFTLVEILVVIAIIAVLLAVTLSFVQARAGAQRKLFDTFTESCKIAAEHKRNYLTGTLTLPATCAALGTPPPQGVTEASITLQIDHYVIQVRADDYSKNELLKVTVP